MTPTADGGGDLIAAGVPVLTVDPAACGEPAFLGWLRAVADAAGVPLDCWRAHGRAHVVCRPGDLAAARAAAGRVPCPCVEVRRYRRYPDPAYEVRVPAGRSSAWSCQLSVISNQ